MAFWVATLSLLVKFFPLPSVLSLMRPKKRRPSSHKPIKQTQKRIAGLLDFLLSADIWVFTPTCWKRAPVLYRYLALNGIETRVLFGMRRGEEGEIDGHAWLESNGQPVLEHRTPTYNVTYAFPPDERMRGETDEVRRAS